MKRFYICVASFLAITACSMAPDYERPKFPVDPSWPTEATLSPDQVTAKSFDPHWQSFFVNENLRRLISLALDNNRDLRTSAQNIKIARAAYDVSFANMFPSIGLGASDTAALTPKALTSSVPQKAVVTREFQANVAVTSFEVDLFGKLDSLKDEAFESYLATDEASKATQISLIAEVANAYLAYVADKQLLDLTEKTLETRRNSLDLVLKMFTMGSSSDLDLAQAQSLIEAARTNVAQYTRQLAMDKSALILLVGATVDEALLNTSLPDLEEKGVIESMNVEMPSDVLLRRPDIASAEHSLKAANANIGAARAAFFPTISLTGSEGFASPTLQNLFKGAAGAWAFTPQMSMPIFDAGKNSANLESAKAAREIAVAQYEKAIQTAFKEVSDDLVSRKTLAQEAESQKALVAATQRSFRLSKARYEHGVSSHLDVLDSERSLYTAQAGEISVRLAQLSNLINLYKAIGGGLKTPHHCVEPSTFSYDL